ncbi:MAG: SWIM zinc finger family protein, partial [Alphaproteobacteria bacterium]|nr:SWIM zinc finger family protein [Alphaproteobacteria bacterium]
MGLRLAEGPVVRLQNAVGRRISFAMSVIPFSEKDIERSFDVGKAATAWPGAGRGGVRSIALADDGCRIVGEMVGADGAVIVTELRVSQGKEIRLSARCSCSGAYNCRHAVTLAFEALTRYGAGRADAVTLAGADARAEEHEPARLLAAVDEPTRHWLLGMAKAVAGAREGGLEENAEQRTGERVLYVLEALPRANGTGLSVSPRAARWLKAGRFGADRRLSLELIGSSEAKYVTDADRTIGRLLKAAGLGGYNIMLPDPAIGALAMEAMLADGRAFWESLTTPPLTLGPPRPVAVTWTLRPDGMQVPRLAAEGLVIVT